MIKKCAICEKSSLQGKVLSRKGQYKSKGGTGSKIARWSKRKFLANLQKVNIMVDGTTKKVFICAKCIKKGSFKKVAPKIKASI
ncbi:MAG: L28 family ribosomal protein [Candidatus Omnitrophica bacterium]|jgi:ribosomal protein L28|nr:bL28 family ribosomal protein [Candidatus Omnitrophota bacterium]MDD3274446.1 L28 family ribosomal protein [Candidatus Omnitrophota bacterium]MDD5077533.1 L28 family ribosomal protein [Candidatus Omnitrophota bacterium]MDD5724923.1 L28 family ribosomal protein [Candidatus Omnitrophota bacterium]